MAKKIRVCPKCESTNISPDKLTLQSAAMMPQSYTCNECGFSSQGFPKVDPYELEEDNH